MIMLIKFIVHYQRINVGGLPVQSESPHFGVQHLWWGFYQPPQGSSLAAPDPPRWLPYVGQLCCCNGCLADKTGESAHSLFYFPHGKCWLDLNGRILILQVALYTSHREYQKDYTGCGRMNCMYLRLRSVFERWTLLLSFFPLPHKPQFQIRFLQTLTKRIYFKLV